MIAILVSQPATSHSATSPASPSSCVWVRFRGSGAAGVAGIVPDSHLIELDLATINKPNRINEISTL
jgi:hypothetical protein